MNAKEARKFSLEPSKVQLEEIFEIIEKAARQGYTVCSVESKNSNAINESIIANLEDLGYRTAFHSNMNVVSTYINISW